MRGLVYPENCYKALEIYPSIKAQIETQNDINGLTFMLDFERILADVLSTMSPKVLQTYNNVIIAGFSQREVAEFEGISQQAIQLRLKNVTVAIANEYRKVYGYKLYVRGWGQKGKYILEE